MTRDNTKGMAAFGRAVCSTLVLGAVGRAPDRGIRADLAGFYLPRLAGGAPRVCCPEPNHRLRLLRGVWRVV